MMRNPRTIARLRWLLVEATCALGDRRVVELRSDAIGAWRTTLPEGYGFVATQALRQVPKRAVAWGDHRLKPGQGRCRQPRRQHPEKRPFESRTKIDAVAEHLGPV